MAFIIKVTAPEIAVAAGATKECYYQRHDEQTMAVTNSRSCAKKFGKWEEAQGILMELQWQQLGFEEDVRLTFTTIQWNEFTEMNIK
ncbi:hypothetical protein D3C81_1397980 [compost metagenome]